MRAPLADFGKPSPTPPRPPTATPDLHYVGYWDVDGYIPLEELERATRRSFTYADSRYEIYAYVRRISGANNVWRWRYLPIDSLGPQANTLPRYGAAGWGASYQAYPVWRGPWRTLIPMARTAPPRWVCFTMGLTRYAQPAVTYFNTQLRRNYELLGCDVLVDMADVDSKGGTCLRNGHEVLCPDLGNSARLSWIGLRLHADALVQGVLRVYD
jgi:hypothetical protein